MGLLLIVRHLLLVKRARMSALFNANIPLPLDEMLHTGHDLTPWLPTLPSLPTPLRVVPLVPCAGVFACMRCANVCLLYFLFAFFLLMFLFFVFPGVDVHDEATDHTVPLVQRERCPQRQPHSQRHRPLDVRQRKVTTRVLALF